MVYKLGIVLYLFLLKQLCCSESVTLDGEPYCVDGSGQHAAPETDIIIHCVVDNPPGLNVLDWQVDGQSFTYTNGELTISGQKPTYLEFTLNSHDNDQDVTDATLTITAASYLDGKIVKCSGTTTTAVSSCSLHILTKPSTPSHFECTEQGLSSFTLLWVAPDDDGGEAVSYELENEISVIYNGNLTSQKITNLQPLTEYDYSISAKNSVGFSSKTNVQCSTTKGKVFNNSLDLEICLGFNESSKSQFILISITSECPPISSDMAISNFTGFAININDYNKTTSDCHLQHSAVELVGETNISVAIENLAGSSTPTSTTFDVNWIKDIKIDLANKWLNYTLPNCTLKVENASIAFNISNTLGNNQHIKDQPYSSEINYFIIPDEYTLSSSLTYILYVTTSNILIASYTGPLKGNSTEVTSKFIMTSTISTSTVSKSTPSAFSSSPTASVNGTHSGSLSPGAIVGISVAVMMALVIGIVTIIIV